MISKQTKVSFYIPKSRKPTIIRPKTDSHWVNNKSITFSWKYNGEDIQYLYQIQLIKTKISKRSSISTTLSSYKNNPSLFQVYQYNGIGNDEQITLDLSSEIPEDGIYIWRIRTQGTIARDWSDWSEDGLVRTDASAPVIRNISAITKSPLGGLAASISDQSFPYIYTNRNHNSSIVKDRHIDRDGQPGLYIYYDYRDNSLNIRAQSGSKTNKRYYGMISFHKDATSLTEIVGSGSARAYDAKYSIQNLVKSVFQYSINKEQNNLGPYDDVPADQIVGGKKIYPSLNSIISSTDSDDGDQESVNFVPQGLPTFISNNVYQNQGFSNHPVGYESSTNYVTTFPMYSRRFQQRTYQFSGESAITFTSVPGEEYIEVRYPTPYQDFFLIFKQTGPGSNSVDLMAYGQYKDESEVKKIMDNPSGSITNYTFQPRRGFSVIQNRSDQVKPNEESNLLFDISNDTLYSRSIVGLVDHEFYSQGIDSDSAYYISPFSYQIFFNLNATFDKDQAVKIYLREETLQLVEYLKNYRSQGVDATYESPFPYVEINFRPDCDCTSVFTTQNNLGTQISLDEIFIGRARTSPRDLPIFNENPSSKIIYEDIKIHYEDRVQTISAWGSQESYFTKDISKYNGSIRLNLPSFEFIPYYHYETAYDSYDGKDPIPHIYKADPNPNNDDTINWDSIVVKSAKATESEKALFILEDMFYSNDFIRFNNTSKYLGQIHPYLHNPFLWNSRPENGSIFGKGKILKHRSFLGNGSVRSGFNYLNWGYTMFEDGWSPDDLYPVTYNQIDRGFFAIVDLENGSEENTTKLFLKDFSNHIFQQSVRVDIKNSVSSLDEVFSTIYPSNHSSHGRTFVWEGTNIQNENVQISGDSNGPTWLFNLEDGSDKTNFIRALISEDNSFQGLFKNTSWARSNSIGFSGLYLIVEDKSTPQLYSEQIERTVFGYDSNEKESYFLRGELRENSLPSVLTDSDDNKNAYVSGDTFELGNIFGYIYPENNNTVKFSFDIDESSSGIDSIKFLEVDIPVELASSDSSEENKSPHYFGLGSSNLPTKVPIKIQKLNEYSYLYDSSSLSLSDDIFKKIRTTRTPLDAIEYFMDNSPEVNYININTSDVLDLDTVVTDYGLKRFTYSLSISGGGFKIIFFKVKDKAGNESNVYAAPIYVQGSQTITTPNDIVSANIAADDRLLISRVTLDILGENYDLYTNLLPTDTRNNRSIVVRDIIVNGGTGNLINHPYPNDLLIGFSDNYGLSYNVFSPLSSISTWNFKRPIALKLKSYTEGYKGPDWYFDPNDIRHYIPDTADDYALGVNDNNNIINVQSFHIPVNPGTKARTLIGFLDERMERYSRSNPTAKRIYENKEEFIGKYLTLGSSLELSFKILDVFRSDSLSPSKRFDSSGQSTENYSADGDGGIGAGQQPRRKVWILIEDEEAIAAAILSRKFQYITDDNPFIYSITKSGTGWRNTVKDSFEESGYVENFGYYPLENEIPIAVNAIINDALNISANITADPDDLVAGDYQIPNAGFGTSEQFIYIDPSTFDDTSSGISSNEGWTTRIYQGYSHISAGATPQTVLDHLQHHQLLGINYYNKMVFGSSYVVSAKISKVYYDSMNDQTYIILKESGIDYTMRNLEYSINNSSSSILDSGNNQNQIKNVSIDGNLIIVYGDVSSILNPDVDGIPDDEYSFNVEIEGLDHIDEFTGEAYDRGWWPKVDGLLVPPIDQKLGSNSTLWNEFNIKFCIVSTGSFYIPKDGEYTFKIEKDLYSYSDFSIDFPGKDVERYVSDNGSYSKKTTSIHLSASSGDSEVEKTVYLLRGWHTARFRARSENTFSEEGYTNYLRLLYSKPGWVDESGNKFYNPLIGSRNEDMNFMSRAYRSVYARILDKDFNRFPKEEWEVSPDEEFNKEGTLLRATAGFRQSPILDEISTSYNFQALKISRDTGDDNRPTISSTSPAEARPTYGAEILEEAQAIYISNIFDGGSDFRFWREISWTPAISLQPNGTEVQFEIRTGSSESDLLSKTWNNIGTETVQNILDPFTQSGQELIDFSQVSVDSNNELILKRFIQFKMTLKSTVKDVTPIVDDVTISYSKQNSVNFFTTTFNLSSNIVRSILTYNGEVPSSSSGVALSDIQFGICTEEDVDGKVITNFDEYTIIPANEAFSLASLGVQQNKKFRIGIRFISTEGSIPTVDEFALMWETDGKRDQVKDLIDRVNNG